jgi:hypothetical protein
MYLMPICFMLPACRFLYDNIGNLFRFTLLQAPRCDKFTAIEAIIQPPGVGFMNYLQHIVPKRDRPVFSPELEAFSG